MHVYVFMCMCLHPCLHTCTCSGVSVCTHMYSCIYAYAHACTLTNTGTHTHMHARTHTHTRTHTLTLSFPSYWQCMWVSNDRILLHMKKNMSIRFERILNLKERSANLSKTMCSWWKTCPLDFRRWTRQKKIPQVMTLLTSLAVMTAPSATLTDQPSVHLRLISHAPSKAIWKRLEVFILFTIKCKW